MDVVTVQRGGLVSNKEHHIRTLVPRQNLTGADRTWAERYEVGDVLRYSRSSKETGIGKGAYAQVKSIEWKNRLTVELQDGTEQRLWLGVFWRRPPLSRLLHAGKLGDD